MHIVMIMVQYTRLKLLQVAPVRVISC